MAVAGHHGPIVCHTWAAAEAADHTIVSPVGAGRSDRFLLAGTSNESGVVDDGNWRFMWLLPRKLQR